MARAEPGIEPLKAKLYRKSGILPRENAGRFPLEKKFFE
jgi:hypothetical protein